MKYLTFFIALFIFSCSKDSPSSEVIATQIEIFIEDSNGNNLLLASSPNAINFDEVVVMYSINGENQIINDIDLECPRSICLSSENGKTWVSIFPNDYEADEYPVTYIDWGNGDIDTLNCHFVRTDNGKITTIRCDKVWYNDSLMFPDNAIPDFGRAFKIVK